METPDGLLAAISQYEGASRAGDESALRELLDPECMFTFVAADGEVSVTPAAALIDRWAKAADADVRVEQVQIHSVGPRLAVVELDFIHPSFTLHDVLVLVPVANTWTIASKLSCAQS